MYKGPPQAHTQNKEENFFTKRVFPGPGGLLVQPGLSSLVDKEVLTLWWDYDNQTPPDLSFPNVPFRDTLNLEGRLLEASIIYGLPRNQLDTVLSLAQERERVVEVQANERYVRHVPEDVERQRRARELLLTVAPTEADLHATERLGIQTTTMHANIDPNEFPPVAEVSAPAFSGPPHKLGVETRDNSTPAASTTRESDVAESPVPKATPKAPPPNIQPSEPTPQYTSWTCTNPTLPPSTTSPTMLMLAPESDWLATQIALCKDGPKPWFQPKDYGASPLDLQSLRLMNQNCPISHKMSWPRKLISMSSRPSTNGKKP
eukprot:3837215-Amphidinium_carterae.1